MEMTIWDERFSGEDFVYGKEPNQFFRQIIDLLVPGKILIPGEGEGRNAVYAAKNGWEVHAFDSSKRGKEKAEEFSSAQGVSINYEISDYQSYQSDLRFDAIALIYTHLHSADRSTVHRKYVDLLNDGGSLILQTFNKKQLGLNTGGPKDLDLLFSVEELQDDFIGLTTLSVEDEYIELSEGDLHSGMAHVISLKGIK